MKKDNLEYWAESALHALTSLTDSRLGYLPYWRVVIDTEYPYAEHTRVDESELVGSWAEAILMTRKMSGSKEGRAAEEGIREILLSNFTEDGIRYHSRFPWSPLIYCNIHEMGYILDGLVTWYSDSKEQPVRKAIENLINGLHNIAVKCKRVVSPYGGPGSEITGCYYFPFENYYQGIGWDPEKITFRSNMVLMNRVMIHPLLRYFKITGYERAFSLAQGLINSLCFLDEKGHQLEGCHERQFDYRGRWRGHFVSAVWVGMGIMKYALLTNNEELFLLMKKVYDWGVSNGSSFGWLPEHINGPKEPKEEACETCNISRMIEAGIILAKSGFPEYWRLIEQYGRNQLFQVQLLETDDIPLPCDSKKDTNLRTYENIAERVKGVMLGKSMPNSLNTLGRGRVIAGCCTAIGAKGLFLLWDNIVERKGNDSYIHLHFSRKTPWLEVKSSLPSCGELLITTFTAQTLFVRISEWGRKEMSLKVNGKEKVPEWSGNYIKIRGLRKGDRILLTFPIQRREMIETIGDRTYKVFWQGDKVKRIDPKGRRYPIYI
ncbi:hypothetical protein E3J84_07305 [Candidatus Aerophobetes bacterium]|uniref:Uncharacterized protein n=1 Tax=Aerophobetes bacterium TaxID=2030807 RepID=A0A523RP78_UNCAE|nr:MAG: hypothetical protein E3J84_07305 [Candidatus Aerophobetes bacterium]